MSKFERLTKYDDDHGWQENHDDDTREHKNGHHACMTKLGEYENSGLSPERVMALAEAERDNRLVMLPCKVGDTVYFVWPVDCYECGGASEGCRFMRLKQQGVYTADCPMEICEIEVDGISVYMDEKETSLEINGIFWFDFTDLSDIKYTRAEAEAALAEMEGKHQ